ncbi:hypothetical protein V5O48_014025 [Marasmius crinis-equi]|uniref:Uncharacterized protein n=1 Tax=Marasmius crinis-equi TaxID=585013 RepID=A0ABR3EYI8_9AGAR
MSLSDEVKTAVLALLKEQLETVRSLTNPPPTSVPNDFVGPYTNPTATVASPSQSLLSSFPEVEAATIASIINHKLEAHDLYKLDSKSHDKTEDQILSLRGGSLTNSASKEYKSLSSVAVPLSTYFSIILAHAETTGRVSNMAIDFFRYNSHLVRIAGEYEWAAVVAYHMAFFGKRRREMQLGDYSGWGRIDVELQGEHLHGFNRRGDPVTATKPGEVSEGAGKENVGVALEKVEASREESQAKADEETHSPTTKEIAAAVTIQQAYRQYRGRCPPPPDAGVAACREYFMQALAESSTIRWKNRRYRLLFLGAVPHAMMCLNSIDAWGTAYKWWMKRMINKGSALGMARTELIRILQFLESARRLKSNLEPQSKLHIKGDIVQLKNDVRDLKDLITRIRGAYQNYEVFGHYHGTSPLDDVNDDLEMVVQSVIVGPVKAAAAVKS